MRLASLISGAIVLPLAACGLETGGSNPDAGIESGLEDRGSGMNEAGMTCACVTNPGGGWQFIAYERDGADTCPSDFATQKFAVEEANTGKAMCTCTCGTPTTNSTCTITSTSISAFRNSNCSGNADATFTATPVCYDVNPDYNPNSVISAKGTAQISVMGGTCGPPMAMTTVPSDLHKGQACSLTAPLGSGCPSMGDVCVPKTAMPFGLCVKIDQADATCPANFTTKHKVGTSKSDSRACLPCMCNPDPLCVVTAKFNDKNDCTGNDQGSTFDLDGACHLVTNSGISGHSLATDISMVMQRCSPMGGTSTGSVSLDNEYTICCP